MFWWYVLVVCSSDKCVPMECFVTFIKTIYQ